jgi:hypothetical protein
MAENPVSPRVTSKDPEGLEFLRRMADVFDEARLSKEEAARVNDYFGAMRELRSVVASFLSRRRHPLMVKGEKARLFRKSRQRPGDNLVIDA